MNFLTTFPLGQIVATQNALSRLTELDITAGLNRHAARDWGELDPDDRAANDLAVIDGERLVSAYTTPSGVTYWIITERDRSYTTVLLPEDY